MRRRPSPGRSSWTSWDGEETEHRSIQAAANLAAERMGRTRLAEKAPAQMPVQLFGERTVLTNEEIFRIRMDGAGRGGAADIAGPVYLPAPRQPTDGNRGNLRPHRGHHGSGGYPYLHPAGKIHRPGALRIPDFRHPERHVRLHAPALCCSPSGSWPTASPGWPMPT